jgi:hypothetical protein
MGEDKLSTDLSDSEILATLGNSTLDELSERWFELQQRLSNYQKEENLKEEESHELFETESSEFMEIECSQYGWSKHMFYNDGGVFLNHLNEYIERIFHIELKTNYRSNAELHHYGKDYRVGIHSRNFDLGRGMRRSLPCSAVYHLINKETSERVIIVLDTTNCRSYENELTKGKFIYDSNKHEENKFWSDFLDDFYINGLLKGERFGADLRLLTLEGNLSHDDIVLDERISKQLDRNITGFINALPEIKKAKLQTSRGIMLSGVPGTGKTLYCKILLGMLEITTIYVTQSRLSAGLKIKHIYDMARRMAPSLVILEDIDTLGGLDRRAASDSELGALLEFLEGIEANSQVITLATTNFPQHLDEALRNRPGRIDAFINIEIPGPDQRKKMLIMMTRELNLADDINWDQIVKLTAEMSGAFLREVISLALITRVYEHGVNDIIIDQAAIVDSCNSTRERMSASKVDITYNKMPELSEDSKQSWG